MTDLKDFSDVLSDDIQIVQSVALEFEFDNFILRRELNHWEITFESEEGEEGIIVEREDFIDGKFEFNINDQLCFLTLEDFDRIEEFVYKNNLI